MWRGDDEYLCLSYVSSLTLWVYLQRKGKKVFTISIYCNKVCSFIACFKHLLRLTIVTVLCSYYYSNNGHRHLEFKPFSMFGFYLFGWLVIRFSCAKPETTWKVCAGAGKGKEPWSHVCSACRQTENMLESTGHQSSPFFCRAV